MKLPRALFCFTFLILTAEGAFAAAQEEDWDEAAFVEKLEAEYQAYRPLAQEATKQFELKLTAYEQAHSKEQWLEDAFAGNRAAQWLVFQAVWRDRYAFLDLRVHDLLLYRWASEIAEEEKYVRATSFLFWADLVCGYVRLRHMPLFCPMRASPERSAQIEHWTRLGAMGGVSIWQVVMAKGIATKMEDGRTPRDQWDKRIAEGKFWMQKANEAGLDEPVDWPVMSPERPTGEE